MQEIDYRGKETEVDPEEEREDVVVDVREKKKLRVLPGKW